MSSPPNQQDKSAPLDRLFKRYDATKHASRYSANMSHFRDHFRSAGVKEEDGHSGGRGYNGSSSSRKKDKKNELRKGKWMKEEEEYATTVIHYFCLGLFTLPAGKTLRTFLADKLSCDPMRITKKFAGASCLSREIRSSCTHPQFTPQEIEEARVELERLEESFMLTLEHGPGAVLPSTNSPALDAGSATSLPPDSNTSCAPATSGGSVFWATNQGQSTGAQASLAPLLAYYNAQSTTSSSDPAATLPFGAAPAPRSDTAATHLHQYAFAPATAPAAAFPHVLQMQSAAPAINLQAMLSNNNLVQPSNPPTTDPNSNSQQQLTLSLVSHLLSQLQTGTVSPAMISQLQNQLLAAAAPPAPPPTQSPAIGINIASLLQSMQGASQASTQGQAGNYAVGNDGLQHFQMMPQAIPAGLVGQNNANIDNAIGQFKYPLTSQGVQQGPQNVCNNLKSHEKPVSEELLSQSQLGQNDAVQRATKESKKRKKGKFTMSWHESSAVSFGSGSRTKNAFDTEESFSSSDPTTSRSKNAFDTEESFSSSDPTTSDAAKGGESSSSNSCSDEEKGSDNKSPSCKHFKAPLSSNGGITSRDLQDHDKRMARNSNK